MRCEIKWEPRDLWVGVFWTHGAYNSFHIYICVVPCFPLHLWWDPWGDANREEGIIP